MKFDAQKQAYIETSQNRIQVEVGDTKAPDEFLPRIKLCWLDNECNVSFGLDTDSIVQARAGKGAKSVIAAPSPTVEVENDTIKWKRDDVEAHFYPLEPFEGGEEGGYEFEVVLNEKPASNIINMTMNVPKELEFYYQPPLTLEEIAEGCERPENVVGSYAVYHSSKQGDFSKCGGKNYRTGKAFHVYRPEAVDAAGAKTWCDLHIDAESQTATITVPQEWLEAAMYPVVVDPTFGYTSVGSSRSGHMYRPAAGIYSSPPVNGAISSMAWYGYAFRTAGPTSMGTAIYSDNNFNIGSLLAVDLGNVSFRYETARWWTVNIIYNFLPNTRYWLAWWTVLSATTGAYFYYDTTPDPQYCSDLGTDGASFETWPSSFVSPGYNYRRPSIYATYEEIVPETYTLTLQPNNPAFGSVSGGGEYTEGQEVELSADPEPYYQFINWTDEEGNIVSTDAEYTFTMPANDVTLTANFEFLPRDFTFVYGGVLDEWEGWAYDIYRDDWAHVEYYDGYYVAGHFRFPEVEYILGNKYYLTGLIGAVGGWDEETDEPILIESEFKIVGDASKLGQITTASEFVSRQKTTAEIVKTNGFESIDITPIVEELAQIPGWDGVIQFFILPTENTLEDTYLEIYPISSVYVDVVEEASATYIQSVGGSISLCGNIAKRTSKRTSGTITPSCHIVKAIQKKAGGYITPSGGLSKRIGKLTGGVILPQGALSKTSIYSLITGGTITPIGGIGKLIIKNTGGTVGLTSRTKKQTHISSGGTITPSGVMNESFSVSVNAGGDIAPTGELGKHTTKSIGGILLPVGSITKAVSKHVGGNISLTGNAAKGLYQAVGGSITLFTNTTKTVFKLIGGGIINLTGHTTTKYTPGEDLPEEETLRLKISRFFHALKDPDGR